MKQQFEIELKQNTRKIKAIANNLKHEKEFDDLVQVGIVEFWNCYLNHQEEIQTWCLYWPIRVKNQMLKHLEKNSRTIRLPSHKVYDKEYIPPTMISTSIALGDDSNETIGDMLIGDYTLQENHDYTQLYSVLGDLNPQDAEILKLRYDLGDMGETATLGEIGEIFGLSREGVRVRLLSIEKKLKKRLENYILIKN